jgi:uncharacterized protein (TIGR02271 family)
VIVRHEEEASLDRGWRGIGFLRARKRTQSVTVREELPLEFEQLVEERVPVAEGDSGKIETLPDGSISIPLYEEELVVTKRTVLRERVIVRKQIAARAERVEAELRREHVEIDADDEVEVFDERQEKEGDRANRQAGSDQASS